MQPLAAKTLVVASGRSCNKEVLAYLLSTHEDNLPLIIGLTATSVGIENVVSRLPGMLLSPADLWLICGAVALCFFALGGIHQTTVAFGTQNAANVKLITELRLRLSLLSLL